MLRNFSRLTRFPFRLLIICALLLCALPAQAQTDGARGTITGRVFDESGQPVANALIFASGPPRGARATSDTEGKFSIDDLARGTYRINVFAPGYFYPPTLMAEPDERSYYHPGDAVTLRLRKGGVLTGRVLDASGELLVAVRVGVLRVRPLAGQPQNNVTALIRPVERATDDRGSYRIYGLPPGVYLVAAGGRGVTGLSFLLSPYDEDVPTYYPSSTRAGASEVVVHEGQEATDIDIRYRGESGHAVSGGVVSGGGSAGTISLTIIPAGVNYAVGYRFLTGRENSPSFVFDALADGDYDVMAEQFGGSSGRNTAASQRVSVRGADVTGLKLVLAPLAAITGRVVLEAAPAAAPWQAQCQSKLDAVMGEIMLNARRAQDARAAVAQPAGARAAAAAPDAKGEFALRSLAAGRFRLKLRPPGPDWYVRAATLAATTPAATNNASAKPNAPAHAAINTNPLADELTLAAGTQVSGLTLTLAPGAAALHGRVAPASEGAPLPDLQIYLVPAERERADDALRYLVARMRNDGTFAFTHLAPGRYHLLTRPAPPHEPNADDALASVYPDAQTRTQLRRDAAPTETLELQPCQRRTDYPLRLRPQ